MAESEQKQKKNIIYFNKVTACISIKKSKI